MNNDPVQSPRPETPEPESRQGRRNPQPGVQLLNDDGGISDAVSLHHLYFFIDSFRENHSARSMSQTHLFKILYTSTTANTRRNICLLDTSTRCISNTSGT